MANEPDPDELLALDESLTRLERVEPRRAKVVQLKYFGGLTIDEIAAALQVATPTVERDWQFARAWLYRELNQG
ncbi:MAG: ECF-type sigma factor [Planctomycetota bacterium]